MAYRETDDEMESSVKDELERRTGVDCTWPGTSFSITQNVQTDETMVSSVVVPLVPPTYRCSRAVAEINEEVGKTVGSHCGTP